MDTFALLLGLVLCLKFYFSSVEFFKWTEHFILYTYHFISNIHSIYIVWSRSLNSNASYCQNKIRSMSVTEPVKPLAEVPLVVPIKLTSSLKKWHYALQGFGTNSLDTDPLTLAFKREKHFTPSEQSSWKGMFRYEQDAWVCSDVLLCHHKSYPLPTDKAQVVLKDAQVRIFWWWGPASDTGCSSQQFVRWINHRQIS